VAIFSHAFEIAHGCGAASPDPAGKTAGIALGFGVRKGDVASLGESSFEGQCTGVAGLEGAGRFAPRVYGRVGV
jgi:hypothetical protein